MSFQGYLAFTLYVGAAVADANGDQKRLMDTKLKPLLKRMKEVENNGREWALVAESMLINIYRIMGPNWRPGAEWYGQIQLLLKDDPHATEIGKRP